MFNSKNALIHSYVYRPPNMLWEGLLKVTGIVNLVQ